MRPYETVVDLSRGVERPRFFAGGQLTGPTTPSTAGSGEGRGQARAVLWEGDDGTSLTLTYAELKDRVDAAAGALRARGVGIGDVVALLLPVMPLFSNYGPARRTGAAGGLRRVCPGDL